MPESREGRLSPGAEVAEVTRSRYAPFPEAGTEGDDFRFVEWTRAHIPFPANEEGQEFPFEVNRLPAALYEISETDIQTLLEISERQRYGDPYYRGVRFNPRRFNALVPDLVAKLKEDLTRIHDQGMSLALDDAYLYHQVANSEGIFRENTSSPHIDALQYLATLRSKSMNGLGTTRYYIGKGIIRPTGSYDAEVSLTVPNETIGDKDGSVFSQLGVLYRKPNNIPHESPVGEEGDERDILLIRTSPIHPTMFRSFLQG
jgi:hypothetical protein